MNRAQKRQAIRLEEDRIKKIKIENDLKIQEKNKKKKTKKIYKNAN